MVAEVGSNLKRFAQRNFRFGILTALHQRFAPVVEREMVQLRMLEAASPVDDSFSEFCCLSGPTHEL